MSDESTSCFGATTWDDVVFACFQAIEARRPIDPDEWCSRYPQFGAELREFFADHQEGLRLRLPASHAGLPRAAGDPTPTYVAPHPSGLSNRRLPCRIGDYELESEIARGGMGVVYRGRQISANRMVAIKMMLGGSMASAEDLSRFRAEAEAAANLDHPNIVPIFSVGDLDGCPFFSMKLIDGGSLADARGRFVQAPRAAVQLLSSVTRAVHYAHQRGVLHRDLKPGNILLEGVKGRDSKNDMPSSLHPYITDFGLAKQLERESDLTESGAILGTPNYMSPEQAMGRKDLTTATDVYSLGTILFELLTGHRPFSAETPMGTILRVQHQDVERPRSLNPQVPLDLETICLKCLEKDPVRRYRSAEELADDLDRWLRAEPIVARPSTPWERTLKWVKRRPAVAALMALVVLTTVAGFLASLWNWQEARKALQLAAEERERAEAALSEARLRNYAANITEAVRICNFDQKAASALLDRCPEELRQWEWQFVRRFKPGVYQQMAYFSNVAFAPGRFAAMGYVKQKPTLFVGVNPARIQDATKIPLDENINAGLVAFLPDGQTLTTFQDDGVIRFYRGPSWRLTRQLASAPSADGTVTSLAASATHLLAVSGNRMRLWNLDSGEVSPLGEPEEVRGAVFSPCGCYLASAHPQRIALRNVRDGELVRSWTCAHDPLCLAFSPDGKILAAGCRENCLWLADPASQDIARLFKDTGPVRALVFSPNGRRIVSGGIEYFKFWDVEFGIEVFNSMNAEASLTQGRGAIQFLVFCPKGETLVVSYEGMAHIRETGLFHQD